MSKDKSESVNQTPEISLNEIFANIKVLYAYLKTKRLIIIFAIIVGAGMGLVYSFYRKPIFKAELNFALDDDKSSGSGLSSAMGLASQFGIDLGGGGSGGAFAGDNLLMLFKSRSMVEMTLLTPVNIAGKNETLADYYIEFNKLRDEWSKKPELKNLNFPAGVSRSKFTLQQDSVLGDFYKELNQGILSVDKADKKLSIITVKVNSTNELFSKVFAEVLVKTVSDFYIQTKTKKSAENVAILQRQTDSVRAQLNAAISGVALSVDNNPNPNPTLQILRAPSQRRQVDVQANQAILTQLVANLEISKVSLRRETPLIQIIDRPILPLEKDKVGKLKGLILGGALSGLLMVIFLIIKRTLKEITT